MGLTSSNERASNIDIISRRMKCGFKNLIDNVKVFLGQYTSKDRRTKILDMSVVHKTFLSQFQISSMKGAVENTKNKYSKGNRLTNLRQYFESVTDFDAEIT